MLPTLTPLHLGNLEKIDFDWQGRAGDHSRRENLCEQRQRNLWKSDTFRRRCKIHLKMNRYKVER